MPKRKAGDRWPCAACGADLIGARTRDGKVAPITLAHQLRGNALVFKVAGVLECRTFAGDALEKLREQQVPLHLNHYASCPHAERFRQANQRQEDQP